MRRPHSSFLLTAFVGAVILCPTLLTAQTNYDTSPSAQTGAQVYGSYFSTDIDSVGLFNANWNLHIPLFSLPGREVSVNRGLAFNSGFWERRDCSGYPCGQYTGGWRDTGIFGAPAPSFFAEYLGCLEDPQHPGNYYPQYAMKAFWQDGDGTRKTYLLKVLGTSPDPYNQCVDPQAPSFNYLTLPSADSDGSKLYTGTPNSGQGATIRFRDGHLLYLNVSSYSNYP